MDMTCVNGQHLWVPVQGWVGRYRCGACNVLGYRGVVVLAEGAMGPDPRSAAARRSRIIPYVCSRKGCQRLAVSRRKSGRCLCAVHLREARA